MVGVFFLCHDFGQKYPLTELYNTESGNLVKKLPIEHFGQNQLLTELYNTESGNLIKKLPIEHFGQNQLLAELYNTESQQKLLTKGKHIMHEHDPECFGCSREYFQMSKECFQLRKRIKSQRRALRYIKRLISNNEPYESIELVCNKALNKEMKNARK